MLGLLDLNKVGKRLSRVDRHLLQTLAVRIGAGSLSDAVAECKRKLQGPFPELTRKEIEDQRIAQAATWAKKMNIDPDYAAAVLYGVISESCRRQMNFLHQHFNDQASETGGDVEDNWRFHREELLRLTKMVAPSYDDNYAKEFFGTKAYLKFEKGELARLIASSEERGLALDLGCATGSKSIMLADNFKKVIGYDISPDMIERANTKLKSENGKASRISFVATDLENGIPQEDASVSLVLMNMGTGSDIKNLDKLLAETHRVLRPGGSFLFSFYNANSLLTKLGFLPWPTSLAAMIDPDKRCLEVHFEKELFFIYARPYTVDELKQLFSSQKLEIAETFTHPSISAALPEDILSTETFGSYGDIVNGYRYKEANIITTHNQPANNALESIDKELAHSPLHLGAYIVVMGRKSE